MSTNPVADYMTKERIGTVELSERLGVSKGYASLLKDGRKPITPSVAKRLARLTGKRWWKYVPEESPAP